MSIYEKEINETSKNRRMISLVIVTVLIATITAIIGFGTYSLSKINTNNLKGAVAYSVKKTDEKVGSIEFTVVSPKNCMLDISSTSFDEVELKANKKKKFKITVLAGYDYDLTFNFYNKVLETDSRTKTKKEIKKTLKKVKVTGVAKVNEPKISQVKKDGKSVTLGKITFNVPAVKTGENSKLSTASPSEVLIYRSTKKNTGFKKIGTVTKYTGDINGIISVSSLDYHYEFIDKTVNSGATYYYKVRAYYKKSDSISKAYYGPYSKVEKVVTSGKADTKNVTSKKPTSTTKKPTSSTTKKKVSLTSTTKKPTSSTTKKKETLQKITLTCPTKAKVGEQFTCRTNMSGVNIIISERDLDKKYKSSFVTTSSDYTKQGKYLKPGKVSVIASKSGYSPVIKNITIYK